MKRSDQDRLLKEILEGEDLADFRQASLDRTLNNLRRQRSRRAVRLGLLASLPLLLAVSLVLHQSRESALRHSAESKLPLADIPQTTAESGGVEFITEEELFALFPNRPLALIGKPGEQELVFLDAARNDEGP